MANNSKLKCIEFSKRSFKILATIILIIVIGSVLVLISYNNVNNSEEYLDDKYTLNLYHFNEDTGSIVYDSSKNNNRGIIYSAFWAEGKIGAALRFNGLDSYVETTQFLETNEGTIDIWIKANDVNRLQHVIWFGDVSSSKQELHISIDDDGKILAYFGSIGTNGVEILLKSNTALTREIWYQITFIFHNGKHYRLYINGILETSIPSKSKIETTQWDSQLRIGRSESENEYFNGIIDEIRISNIARDIHEIDIIPPLLFISLFICFVQLFSILNPTLSISNLTLHFNIAKNWKLFVIVVFFNLLKLLNLDVNGMLADEPYYLDRALLIAEDARFAFIPFSHRGFLYMIFAFSIKLLKPLGFTELFAVRCAVVLFSTAFSLSVYKIGEKLFGEKIGFYAAIITTFEPIFFGWSRVAYLDIPTLLFGALCIFFVTFEKNNIRRLTLAGTFFGLLLSSKMTYAQIYIPLIIFIIFLKNGKETDNKFRSILSNFLKAIIQTVEIIILGIIVFISSIPFLWSNPIDGLTFLYKLGTGSVAVSGHPIFFLGNLWNFQPAHFYLVLLPVSITPIFLFLALTGFLYSLIVFTRNPSKFTEFFLIIILSITLLFESISPTKLGMRYIFMIMLPLAIYSGRILQILENYIRKILSGKTVLSSKLSTDNGIIKIFKIRTVLPYVVPLMLVVLVISSTISWYPYTTLYYSPVFRPLCEPDQVMQIGGGEGLKEASFFLNSLPLKNGTVGVLTWYEYLITPYLDKKYDLIDLYNVTVLDENVDYVIVYINWIQRFGGQSVIWTIIENKEVVYTYSLNGIWLVKIFKV